MMLSDPSASAAGIASDEAPRSARRDRRIFPDERDVRTRNNTAPGKDRASAENEIPADVAGLGADLNDASSVGKLGLDERSPCVPAEDGRQAEQYEFKRQPHRYRPSAFALASKTTRPVLVWRLRRRRATTLPASGS